MKEDIDVVHKYLHINEKVSKNNYINFLKVLDFFKILCYNKFRKIEKRAKSIFETII